jgi:hypothetical protein
MAGPLKPITHLDFSKGENTVASPYDLAQGQVQQAINLMLDEHGSLRTRDGTLLQTSSPVVGAPICKLWDFVKVDGTIIKLAIVRTNPLRLYNRGTTPWTLIGTFNTGYAMPDIVPFTNQVHIAAGQTEGGIRTYDGTTFGTDTGSPNANHIAVHLSYLWAWNTAAATSSTDGPSSLRSSDVNNPNSWPTSNQTFISKDDGQSGQGIALFTIAETGISPTATLIAFKDFSGYEVTGVFGGTLSVQKIKSDMGCVAGRTIQFISGFGVVRLTHRGFALYDGVNDTLISEEERPRLFGRDSYTGLDWSNIGYSVAAQVANPPMYICACPVSGQALTRWFFYDLVRRAWTVATFANAVSTIQLILDPNNLPVVLGGDFSGQGVRRYFAGDQTDDGTAITWQMIDRPVASGSPMSRSYFRRFLLKTFGFTQGTVITATLFTGPATGAQGKTQTVNITTTSTALSGYGIDAYGTTGYGGVSGAANLTDVESNFDVGMKANNLTVQLQGTGYGKIRGIEYQVRELPATRSVALGA